MRKIIVFTLFCFFAFNSFGQVRFGLEVTPFNLNMLNAQNDGIDVSTGTTLGAKLVVDNPISESAYLSTGLEIIGFSNELSYATSLLDSASNVVLKSTYLNIPISLKLKMSQFGLFTPFAQIGVEPGVSLAENAPDDTSIFEFGVRAFNLPLSFAVGTEYQLSDRNSVYASLFYRYGLTNNVKDNYILENDKLVGDGDRISLNNFGLRIGILF